MTERDPLTDPVHPSPVPPPEGDIELPPEGQPHLPWWKDERLFGKHGPSNVVVVRLLIVAFTAALIVLGYIGYRSYIIGTGTLDYIHDARKERLASQEQVKIKLKQLDEAIAANKAGTRDLACSVVVFLQHQPQKSQAFIQFLTDRYSCDTYRVGAPIPSGSTTTPSGFVGPLPTLAPPPAGQATSSAGPGAPVTPRPGSTATRTVVRTSPAPPRPPGPTRTRTVTPSPSPSTTHILCLLQICI
jgi:hypothetical protein